jgi:hypothetical protein
MVLFDGGNLIQPRGRRVRGGSLPAQFSQDLEKIKLNHNRYEMILELTNL